MEAHPNKSGQKPYIATSLMIEMYSQGKSSEQIAKSLGLVKSSVSRRLRKAGVALRTSSDYLGEMRYWVWTGTHSDIERKRGSRLHRAWSKRVFQRDNAVCQDCQKTDVRLHAHHLVSLRDCINTELEFDIKNGITLCVPCHGARHKALRKVDRKSTT